MSAASTSPTESGFAGLPGLDWTGDGSVHLDGRLLARMGSTVPEESARVVVQSVAAGARWHAEQVLVDGRCVALRLRPQVGSLAAAWRRWFGESWSGEASLAARWGAPLFAKTLWGSATAGIDPTLRGAAVITLRAQGAPDPLPPAGPAFWRRRGITEVRPHIEEALQAAAVWTVTPEALVLPGEWVLPTGQHGCALMDGWASALPHGFQWREGAGQWRARGAVGGWRFTLAFVDHDRGPVLRWMMARLEVADEGAWEPSLECALQSAHRRWAETHLPATCRWQSVNDEVAKTGAELLIEWPEG